MVRARVTVHGGLDTAVRSGSRGRVIDVRAAVFATSALAAGAMALWRLGGEILDDMEADLDPDVPHGFEVERLRPTRPAYDRTL